MYQIVNVSKFYNLLTSLYGKEEANNIITAYTCGMTRYYNI
mgnify:CR=1 FL=1